MWHCVVTSHDSSFHHFLRERETKSPSWPPEPHYLLSLGDAGYRFAFDSPSIFKLSRSEHFVHRFDVFKPFIFCHTFFPFRYPFCNLTQLKSEFFSVTPNSSWKKAKLETENWTEKKLGASEAGMKYLDWRLKVHLFWLLESGFSRAFYRGHMVKI